MTGRRPEGSPAPRLTWPVNFPEAAPAGAGTGEGQPAQGDLAMAGAGWQVVIVGGIAKKNESYGQALGVAARGPQVGELFGEREQAAVQPPLDGLGGHVEQLRGFRVRQPLDAHQVDHFALLLGQGVDRRRKRDSALLCLEKYAVPCSSPASSSRRRRRSST
jgi:hypothetical protein